VLVQQQLAANGTPQSQASSSGFGGGIGRGVWTLIQLYPAAVLMTLRKGKP